MGRTQAAGAVALLAIGLAAAAASQTVRERSIIENPYRSPGGSCIYGGKGQLVFAPRGVTCPEVQGALEPASTTTLTPELAQHMRELFATHAHIGDEIVAARRAVESGAHAEALSALDHVLAELSVNKAAAERVLGEISRSPTAR